MGKGRKDEREECKRGKEKDGWGRLKNKEGEGRKEGGGMNEPEKDRCWLRGGRGTLVLLLSSLSLALYSASIPGQGVQGGWEVTEDRHSPPQREEGANRTNVTRYNRGGERKRKGEKILAGVQQMSLGSFGV